ncbi:MAG: hypothetical protein HY040_03120 [Planctomycetes bacterium]|nr:hypothetical protein [Planctomycetota bacterium]
MSIPIDSTSHRALDDGHSPQDWEARFRAAEAECDRLREELKKVTAARDVFLKSLFLLSDQGFSHSKERLAQLGQGKTLRQIIEEMAKEEKLSWRD